MDKPTSLDEIYAQQQYWSKRLDRAEARKRAAEKTIDQCRKRVRPSLMVEQLAELLRPHFPDHRLDVLGPFGLANEMSIHARVWNPESGHGGRFDTVGSLSFRPKDMLEPVGDVFIRSGRVLVLVDWTRNTGEFPAGSIGAVNQLNFPDKDLPDTIEELADLLHASIGERV